MIARVTLAHWEQIVSNSRLQLARNAHSIEQALAELLNDPVPHHAIGNKPLIVMTY